MWQGQDPAETIAEQHEITRRELKGAIAEAFKDLQLREPHDFSLRSLMPSGAVRNEANSYAKTLLQEEREILNSLKFPVMLDREEDISIAEKKTFDWIFEDPKPEDLPWANFRAWLREDDPLYWITGKAGSGKSTLMKYIFCDPRTRRSISRWATSAQPLVIAGFFFCCMRRIWAHETSFLVPRPRDTAHLGSDSAQSLLKICSGRLTFAHPYYHFRQAELLQL